MAPYLSRIGAISCILLIYFLGIWYKIPLKKLKGHHPAFKTTNMTLKLTFKVVLVTLLITQMVSGQAQSYSPEVEERIIRVENGLSEAFDTDSTNFSSVAAQISKYGLTGVSIAVINNYEVEWAKAYGLADKLDETPASTNTLFQAASMSKTVNAMAILKLVENKGVDLDAEVNSLLKNWQLPYDLSIADQRITLRQLLSHTAGLSIHGFYGYKKPHELPDIIQILEGQKPAISKPVVPIMAPGQEFKYSGGGTTLSQLVLMDITNAAYEQYLASKIFQPLGLENAFYSIELDKYQDQEMAHGHVGKGKPFKNKYNYYPESAAAGLWITPTDLAILLIDLQKSLNGKAGKVLSVAKAQEMITPPIEHSISALGMFIEKKKEEIYLQHSGSNRGFRGKYIIGAHNGKGVVVMVNDSKTQIIDEIIHSVSRVYDWPGFEPVAVADISFSQKAIQAFSGTYQNKKRALTVSYKSDAFVISEKGKWASELIPLSENSFLLKDINPQTTIEFVADASGEVVKLIATQGESLTWTKIDK